MTLGNPFNVADRPSRQVGQEARSDRFREHKYGHSVVRGMRRKFRKLGVWSARMHRASNKRRLERYGLDVTGDAKTVANERRLLRNARKREARL